MLFDPSMHEPAAGPAWDPAGAEAAIREIARDADAALRGGEFWPWHPLDFEDGDPDVVHGVYLGAAGMLLALQRLAEAGLHEPGHDYPRLAGDALESYLRQPEFEGPLPSMWMGEGGIALVAWLLAPEQRLLERLRDLVAAPPDQDTLELMWGSPGLLLIAEAIGAADHARAIVDHLLGRWDTDAPGVWLQDLYGSKVAYLGPAHGFAGVVATLAAHGAPLETAAATLSATAVREDDLANWPPTLGAPLVDQRGEIRTQWCHGAPGMVASLAALPRDDELDELLLAGGELTWAAGPLRKGANLCHGTAGNGFAFLKLFTRTGDEQWLDRARRFAMHAAAQVAHARRRFGQGRYSLWTGDVGTAIYLKQCLAATSDVPTIDAW
jgi:hypothetical protein